MVYRKYIKELNIVETTQKIGRFKKSWLLTKSAWHGFRLDKELIALPMAGLLISTVLIVAVVAAAILSPNGIFYNARFGGLNGELTLTPWGIAALVAVTLIITIIGTFVTGAVVHAALERFKGNDPTIRSSLRAAWSRIGSLSAFSVFSYTVGFVISELASRIPVIGGAIVGWLAGAAWNVASFFAIPVIVSSDTPQNPISATKRSLGIIKQVWGESLIVSATVGIIAFLTILAYSFVSIAGLAALGIWGASGIIMGVLIGLVFFGLIGIILLFSVLEGFVKAAIYHYATTGESPATFNRQLMHQAFTPKKARKVFSL